MFWVDERQKFVLKAKMVMPCVGSGQGIGRLSDAHVILNIPGGVHVFDLHFGAETLLECSKFSV